MTNSHSVSPAFEVKNHVNKSESRLDRGSVLQITVRATRRLQITRSGPISSNHFGELPRLPRCSRAIWIPL